MCSVGISLSALVGGGRKIGAIHGLGACACYDNSLISGGSISDERVLRVVSFFFGCVGAVWRFLLPFPEEAISPTNLILAAPPSLAHFRGDLWVFMLLFPTPDEQGANYS